jgi:TrmH family RNA methyltransferase
MTITSAHNEKLKEVRKLNARRRERERSGRFVAEGEDLLAAADAAGWGALTRLSVEGSGLGGEEVLPVLLDGVSELGSGTRALAIYEERWASAPSGPLCVYLHGVHDPGNVGAVLRSAQAFGASCVALGPGSADPYGPKAVRASMGSIFSVPLARAESITELPGTKVALDADAPAALSELSLEGAVTLLIGAEREGLPEELKSAADQLVAIPTAIHSLNAAMAATVALYELTTRRIGAGT